MTPKDTDSTDPDWNTAVEAKCFPICRASHPLTSLDLFVYLILYWMLYYFTVLILIHDKKSKNAQDTQVLQNNPQNCFTTYSDKKGYHYPP
jgi:hypothetical protein